jgi:hypothetical protein
MNKCCSHCGFANAEKAIRCENCKLFLGISSQDKGISTFSGIRLIIILVVVGLLSLGIYKIFDNLRVVSKPNANISVSNASISNTTSELEAADAREKRVRQAEFYQQKRDRKEAQQKEAIEGKKDIFGNPEPSGCETYIKENGERIEKGDC